MELGYTLAFYVGAVGVIIFCIIFSIRLCKPIEVGDMWRIIETDDGKFVVQEDVYLGDGFSYWETVSKAYDTFEEAEKALGRRICPKVKYYG